MAYFTDQELAAAVTAVEASILEPLNLQGMATMMVKDLIHGFIQRQVANALTAAAYQRGLK